MLHENDLWVFGYGSLMWRPGFDFAEKQLASIHGYHRAMCIYSHVHRGTREKPGLVLGLDHGGSCKGIAFRVAAANVEETLAYLREREQATSVYVESRLTARLCDGRKVSALAYTADRGHHQYAGKLSQEEVLRLVTQGIGISGPNPDYVCNTQAHLHELAIRDATLEWLAKEIARVPLHPQ